MKAAALLLLLTAALAGCVGTSANVEAFHDLRQPAELDLQQLPDVERPELARSGVRGGLSHPDGYYRVMMQLFYESVDAELDTGAASFSGLGAGFSVSGRRIEGVMERDSRWLLPYSFSFNISESTGSDRPTPDLEYERFFYNEALFELGLGIDLTPLLLHAGWSVAYLNGQLNAIDLSGPTELLRRNTFNAVNHGPYLAAELVYADERPVHVELRVGGGDLERVYLSAGVGF
jgi:hypothetical protein